MDGSEDCHKKQDEVCYALYDIATGAILKIPETAVRNLNAAGAPQICHALRVRVTAPEALDYERGLLVEVPEAGLAHVVLRNCRGHSTTLRTSAEPRNLEFRGGLLSWDTGHPAEEFEEEVAGSRFHFLQHGTITSYAVNTRRERHAWKIPVLPLHITGNQGSKTALGAFGYSAHTDYAVFWVASEQLVKSCGSESCSSEVVTSSLYSAPL